MYTARMKVVFFGTPEFAVPTLQGLLNSRHEVRLVVSKPDKPVGRRQDLVSPPVVDLAKRHEIDCLQPKNLKGAKLAGILADSGADAAVVVAYGKLIPSDLISIPPRGGPAMPSGG